MVGAAYRYKSPPTPLLRKGGGGLRPYVALFQGPTPYNTPAIKPPGASPLPAGEGWVREKRIRSTNYGSPLRSSASLRLCVKFPVSRGVGVCIEMGREIVLYFRNNSDVEVVIRGRLCKTTLV